jgi:hypothetical protein
MSRMSQSSQSSQLASLNFHIKLPNIYPKKKKKDSFFIRLKKNTDKNDKFTALVCSDHYQKNAVNPY